MCLCPRDSRVFVSRQQHCGGLLFAIVREQLCTAASAYDIGQMSRRKLYACSKPGSLVHRGWAPALNMRDTCSHTSPAHALPASASLICLAERTSCPEISSSFLNRVHRGSGSADLALHTREGIDARPLFLISHAAAQRHHSRVSSVYMTPSDHLQPRTQASWYCHRHTCMLVRGAMSRLGFGEG